MDKKANKMKKTWPCSYWVTFGKGDGSDPVDLAVPVTDAEYEILEKLKMAQAGEEFEDEETEARYSGKYIDDFPELGNFVDRVDTMAYNAAAEDLSETGEEEYLDTGYRLGYSFGWVE